MADDFRAKILSKLNNGKHLAERKELVIPSHENFLKRRAPHKIEKVLAEKDKRDDLDLRDHMELACAHSLNGDNKSALEHADLAIALSETAELGILRAIILERLKMNDEAVSQYLAVTGIHPGHPHAHRYLGELLEKMGQNQRAKRHLDISVGK